MKLRFDYNNMMSAALGGGEGFEQAEIDACAGQIAKAYNMVMQNRGKGWQEWTKLPFEQEEVVEDILATAKKARAFDNFVVLGIGGSALGPLAVANALMHLRHNELPKSKRNAPKYYIEDNIDPERMQALLDVIDIKDTVFNVITKSGETSETLSQFLILYSVLKKAVGEKAAKERIIVTTTVGKGTLYEIAAKEGFKIFGLDGGVGGRFSVLSAVGLVPFAVLGIDIKAMLNGARTMSGECWLPDFKQNPALATAVLQCLSMQRGRNISVMMPYADSLKYFSDFYCQIWAESLGKNTDLDGNKCSTGQTPVKSLGVTDQHSQVQLYTEGPFDKVITFLAVDKFRSTVSIPEAKDYATLDFLQNTTLDDLLNCERVATEFALTKAGRANFTIYVPEVTAETVGEILQYFMYQTAFAGAFLNIDTFNQPGVEEGKKATFAMLGRKGYEEKLKEIISVPKNPGFVIG